MAKVSSHTLSGVDGSHAGGIAVRLINLTTGRTVFDTKMDDGGRLIQEVAAPDPEGRYELVFQTGAYWQARVPRHPTARASWTRLSSVSPCPTRRGAITFP